MIPNTGGGVYLQNLDDFINPSESCILPFITEPEKKNSLVIHKNAVATINLDDCVSCSGCLTSAETKMLESHNIDVFEEILGILKTPSSPLTRIVITFSPQSLISLATYYECELLQLLPSIENFLVIDCGVSLVLHNSVANDVCLMEAADEFIEHYSAALKESKLCCVISSTCPGYVCFAEKSHGKLFSPHVSKNRSPQGVMGAYLKHSIGSRIYHVSVQPCFDRKLEAARPEFRFTKDPSSSSSDGVNQNDVEIRETDLVLGTNEFIMFLKNRRFEIGTHAPLNFVPKSENVLGSPLKCITSSFLDNFFTSCGGGSGGNALHVLRLAARVLFSVNIEIYSDDNSAATWSARTISTGEDEICKFILKQTDVYKKDWRDWILYRIEDETQTPVLSCAQIYGFKNIQKIVKKLKSVSKPLSERFGMAYNYIELMACPNGGCLNGGAQRDRTGERDTLTIANQYLSKCQILYNETYFSQLDAIERAKHDSEDIHSQLKNLSKMNGFDLLKFNFNIISAENTLSSLTW